MNTYSINKFELTFRGNLKRFNFYTYSQLVRNHVNLGGFLKEIKGTAFWFLYAKKQDFVFLNLMPTLLMLRSTARTVEEVIFSRGKFMFVNNDSHLFWGAMHAALECGESFCVSGWVGGTLTNFKKLFFFFSRFLKHTDWESLTNPRARLRFSLQGFSYLSGPPRLIFINSLKHSPNVANEAHAVFIPAIGLVDIDTNSSDAAYLIPSNDDSKISLDFFNHLFGRLILGCKFKMAKNFLMRKSKREENFLNNQQVSFWLKMFKFRLAFEDMHTKSFRLYLRNWIALSGFRKAFSGVFVENFLDKKIEGFIFRFLRNKPFYHFKKLRTLRVLKNKANQLYARYYKRFFFLKDKSLTVKYSIQMEYFMYIAKWFVSRRKQLQSRSKWFSDRLFLLKNLRSIQSKKKAYKDRKIVTVLRRFVKLQRFFVLFYRNFMFKYTSFFSKHYKMLYSIISSWNNQKSTNLQALSNQIPMKMINKYDNNNGFAYKNRSQNFRYTNRFKKPTSISKKHEKVEINPKLKGLRYWMAVFETKPWLKAREPIYFLHYPANFRKHTIQNTFLQSFLKTYKDGSLKEKELFSNDITSFENNYNIEDYYKLIPENLRLYYYYMDFKYDQSSFVKLYDLLERYKNNHQKGFESENDGLLNLLNFKDILEKKNQEIERLAKEKKEKEKQALSKEGFFLPYAKPFQHQLKIRFSGFNILSKDKTFDWPAFHFLSQLDIKQHKKSRVSFLRSRYGLFKQQYQYLNIFYNLGLKFRSTDMRRQMKAKYLITGFLLKCSHQTKAFQQLPENIKSLYISNIDKTKLPKSRIHLKYKKRSSVKFNKINASRHNIFQKNKSHKLTYNKPYRRRDKNLFVSGSDWLSWYGRNITRLNAFFVRKLLSRYVIVLRRLMSLMKKGKLRFYNRLLTFLQQRLIIIFLLKGFACVPKKDRKFFRNLLSRYNNMFGGAVHKSFFNRRWIFRLLYKFKKRKVRYSAFLYFLLNVKTKAMVWPHETKWSFNADYSSRFLDQKYFFNKSIRNIAKDRILKKFRFYFGDNWSHGERWSQTYIGIPTRKLLFFRKLETSKFYKVAKRKLIMKPRAYLSGKTLLESFLNDVQYGRVKGSNHLYILREIMTRIQLLKHRKWLVFMQMLKNNKFVDKPFLKNDLDKFVHPKIFLLRNYGSQKFKRVKKQTAVEKKAYIEWFLTQQRTHRSFPGRIDTEYIVRLWGNKSIYMAT